jgi:uncharacterized membrane protein YeaQ/YmgE (transglycosylase-associated protein family)
MAMSTGQLIVWLIIGGLAGLIAGWLVRGRKRGFGLAMNLAIGLIGAVIGGFLFQALGIRIGDLALTFSLTDLVAAVVGSLLLVGVITLARRY